MFPIHTVETAPTESQPTLKTVRESLGAIPSLAAGMAASPTLLRGFFALRQIYSEGTLDPGAVQALSLANAVENDCGWCVAFHSRAAAAARVPPEVVAALRAGETPPEPRYAALTSLTRELLRRRGSATPEALERFIAAGFQPAQALEVVLGIGFSVLANYAGALIRPPLDGGLEGFGWEPGRYPAP